MAPRLQIQKEPPTPTFHPFKRLPLELRSKIWLNLLPGPRVIEIVFEIILSPPLLPNTPTHIYRVTSPTKTPLLLFINHESRQETQRFYKALNFGPGFHIPKDIYIDFKFDTIYLSAITNHANLAGPNHIPPINITQSPQLSHLRTLAIHSHIYPHLHQRKFLSTSCPNLTTLIIAFQKTTLHDIKPASSSETCAFMDDKEYFRTENPYTQGLFRANYELRVSAGEAWCKARNVIVEKDFLIEGTVGNGGNFGKIMIKRVVGKTALGGNKGRVVEYELEIGGRKVELRFVVALYPREKRFEGLRSRLRVNGV